MRHLISAILFFIICISFGKAQYFITGKVFDKVSKTVLVGATITCSGKIVSKTNENGEFKLDNSYKINNITISYTGFKTVNLSVDKTDFFSIEMEYSINNLDEIIVGVSAEKIVRKAIEKIKENYPQKNTLQQGILRLLFKNVEKNPDAFNKLSIDAAIKMYCTPYTRNCNSPEIVLIENRKKVEESIRPLRNLHRHTNFWYQPETADFVHKQTLFVDKACLEQFKYTLYGKLAWKGRTVYNIGFQGKKANTIEGYMYIDTVNYAFVYANFIQYNIHELFYKTIAKQQNNISYKLNGSIWCLDEFEILKEFKLTGNSVVCYGYKAFQSLQIDTINVERPFEEKAIELQNEAADFVKEISDTSWRNYDSLFKQKENEKIFKEIEFSNDSMAIISKTPPKKDILSYLDKYMHSSKFSIGYSLQKLPASFMGIQDAINKKIPSSSEFSLNLHLLFKIYKNLRFEMGVANNFGIGGINVSQHVLSFCGQISLSKKIFLEPSTGFSRMRIQDKNTEQLTLINSMYSGIRLSKQLGNYANLFFQIGYLYPLSVQESLINIRYTNISNSIGVILKR